MPIAHRGITLRQRQQPVEIGAADMDARRRENVGLAVGRPGPLGRNADHREVRGAAADVDDQRQFLAVTCCS